jgi:hypothetical protein
MSRRRPVDRGKVTERTIDGAEGRRISEAAGDLGLAAQHFALDFIGPHLTPDRLEAMLKLGDAGFPVEVVIRLSPPRAIRLFVADLELFRAEMELVQ